MGKTWPNQAVGTSYWALGQMAEPEGCWNPQHAPCLIDLVEIHVTGGDFLTKIPVHMILPFVRKAIQMNLPVLIETARVWVEVFDYSAAGSPRTPPLPSLTTEVLPHGIMETSSQTFKMVCLYLLNSLS